VIDELEDDRLEVEMVDSRCLELTSQLNIVLLILFLEDQLGEVSLGGAILSLDLIVHFLETNDDESQDLLFLLVHSVLLSDLEVVLELELVNDLLHVLSQQEGEQWSELVLGDLESLNEDLREEDDALTTKEQSVQSFVLSALTISLSASPLLRVMGRAVQITSLLVKRTGDLEGLGTVVLPLELVLLRHH